MSQIEELRQLIVGANAEQLAELKDRLENLEKRTADVAEVLPPAITAGLKYSGKELVNALQEPVSIGLKQAIRAEPEEYAEILYPVMAPAIRRAISQAISSLMITINRTAESATSIEGIKTRIQSIRTGIPYAELALRHSLLYRVEHIYLIDRASGIKIDEVASEEAMSLDSDAVSAMFSAIQSFVQDSFSQDKTEMLTDLKVGKYNVWVAHGPTLMLACVINGDAPEGLKDDLYDALYSIRTRYGNQIADFDGDVEAFDGVQDLMQPMLQLELKDNEKNQSRSDVTKSSSFLPAFFVFLVIAAAAYYFFDRSTKVGTVEHFLQQTPGISTTHIYWEDGVIVVEGFQDPDAKVPFAVLDAYGVTQETLVLNTIPFRSLDVSMELLRFREEFTLPSGVNLAIADNEVQLSGESPISWLNANDIRIRQLAADSRLNISMLAASRDSIWLLLQNFLNPAELSSLSVSYVSGKPVKVARIEGTLAASKMALIKALFANNVWVDVAINVGVNRVTKPLVKTN